MSEPFHGVRRWTIVRDARSVALKLDSAQGTGEFLVLDAIVPDLALVDWLIEHCDALLPGDEITTSAGDLLRWGGGRLRLISIVLPDGKHVFDSQIARA